MAVCEQYYLCNAVIWWTEDVSILDRDAPPEGASGPAVPQARTQQDGGVARDITSRPAFMNREDVVWECAAKNKKKFWRKA
jgi:hypothetical protein